LQPLRFRELDAHGVEAEFTGHAAGVVSGEHVGVRDFSAVADELAQAAEEEDLEQAANRDLEEGLGRQRAGEGLVWQVHKLLGENADETGARWIRIRGNDNQRRHGQRTANLEEREKQREIDGERAREKKK
jgi:hypothetical protein